MSHDSQVAIHITSPCARQNNTWKFHKLDWTPPYPPTKKKKKKERYICALTIPNIFLYKTRGHERLV